MTSREIEASLRKPRLTGYGDDVEANLGAFPVDLRKTTQCEPTTGNYYSQTSQAYPSRYRLH